VEDPGCHAGGVYNPDHPSEISTDYMCSDGIDNDGDGNIDGDDVNCEDGFDTDEISECADGIDNDGDGWVDHDGNGLPERSDPGCVDANDASENHLGDSTGKERVTITTQTALGFYADPMVVVLGGDSVLYWSPIGMVSCAASGDWSGIKSASGNNTEPISGITEDMSFTLLCEDAVPVVHEEMATITISLCSDGVDNDRDGAVDLADPDCAGDPLGNDEGAGDGISIDRDDARPGSIDVDEK
jgi:hypothetical protein